MTVRTLALALAVTVTLTACSGGGGETAPLAAPAGSTPTTTAVTGVATTAPGTILALGEPGTVAWQVDAETTGTVELVVSQVQRKARRVLAGWVPEDQVAGTTPYFVRAGVTNAGQTELGGAALPLFLRGSGGVLTPAATFGSDYGRCPSTPLPESFSPGDSAEVCLVYTLAPKVAPDAMTFQPTSSELGVAWSVR